MSDQGERVVRWTEMSDDAAGRDQETDRPEGVAAVTGAEESPGRMSFPETEAKMPEVVVPPPTEVEPEPEPASESPHDVWGKVESAAEADDIKVAPVPPADDDDTGGSASIAEGPEPVTAERAEPESPLADSRGPAPESGSGQPVAGGQQAWEGSLFDGQGGDAGAGNDLYAPVSPTGPATPPKPGKPSSGNWQMPDWMDNEESADAMLGTADEGGKRSRFGRSGRSGRSSAANAGAANATDANAANSNAANSNAANSNAANSNVTDAGATSAGAAGALAADASAAANSPAAADPSAAPGRANVPAPPAPPRHDVIEDEGGRSRLVLIAGVSLLAVAVVAAGGVYFLKGGDSAVPASPEGKSGRPAVGNPAAQDVPKVQLPPDKALQRFAGRPSRMLGRVTDAHSGLSYPRFAAPWQVPTKKNKLGVTGWSGQQILVTEKRGGQMWYGQLLTGTLVPTLQGAYKGPDSVKTVAALAANGFEQSYYAFPHKKVPVASQPLTIGGRQGWLIASYLTYKRAGVRATGEVVVAAIIDTGRPSPGVVFASVPNTHRRLWPDLNQFVTQLKVLP